MIFKEIFEVPSEAQTIETILVTSYERQIIECMQKKTFDKLALQELIDAHFASINIEIDSDRLIWSMYHRAVINKVMVSEAVHYEASTVYYRLAYLAQYERDLWEGVDVKIREAIDRWYVRQYAEGALPRLEEIRKGERDLIENAYFFTLDETLTLIDELQEELYVVPCNCRSIQLKCDAPKNVCILFEKGINTEYDRGRGHVISKEEAKALVIKADKAGLMHTSEKEHAICNCCGDCCYPIRASEVIGATGIWPKRRYDISFDAEGCINCGKCASVCHFAAFTKDETVTFEPERCLGCTVCSSHCPIGAIKLIKL